MSLTDARPMPSLLFGLLLTALSLQRDGNLTRERLEEFAAPPAIRRDDAFAAALNHCIEFGILFKEGETLSVAPALMDEKGPTRERLAAAFRTHILTRLAQDAECDPRLCRILAWSLLQPGPQLPLSARRAEQLWNEQDPSRDALGLNDVRFISFTHWARFLGFAWWQSLDGAMALQPDPTASFEAQVRTWTQEEIPRRLPLTEFLRHLESQSPWLESGSIARETRARLTALPPREAGRVSDTTSLALNRLEKKGLIRLLRLSDAASPLSLAWGGQPRVISHVEWGMPE